MPKVSIIIPVYNGSKFIIRTLNSVLKQTFQDFEIICINDCSKDNSLEIIQEFIQKDSRIKIINNSKNMGAPFSINEGLNISKGEYIYFLDADDYIDERYLECMVEKIELEKCEIVLNLSVLQEKNGNSIPYIHPSLLNIKVHGEFLDNIRTTHDAPCFLWARIYKKSFFDNNNLCLLNTHAYDVVFNTITNMYCSKTFIFKGEYYHYTINSASMTEQASSSNTKDLNHIKAHSMIYDYLKEHNKLDDRLKLFRVYPFIKVDTEEKFNFYKKFFEKIENDFHKNENIYNEMEKFFAYSLLNSVTYEEYLKNYNKVVTIGFLRRKKG